MPMGGSTGYKYFIPDIQTIHVAEQSATVQKTFDNFLLSE